MNYTDPLLGEIAVTVNMRSRRFIFRCREGKLTCTMPPPYSERALRDVIDRLRSKLQDMLDKEADKAQARRYTPLTRIDSDGFHVRFVQDDISAVTARMDDDTVTIRYRSPELLAEQRVQQWITNAILSFARKRVRNDLPPRLRLMAQQRGLTANSIKVSSAKRRWGSCSTRGNINLSLFLAFLPRHLQDYVMQHELTHLIEMNHGPRFWALLDKVCKGQALSLRRELKRYDITLPPAQN